MKTLKEGVRVIGIDDGPFNKGRRAEVLVVGAIYRGGHLFDGLLTTKIRKDGWNATERIVAMIRGSKFHPQLHYAIFDGIALGGFNIIDVERFYRDTGLKTMVFMRRAPDMPAIRRALSHLTRPEARLARIARAGACRPVGEAYCQLKGMSEAEAAALLALTCTRSKVPEPVRAAHLIGGGVVLGQSGRRA